MCLGDGIAITHETALHVLGVVGTVVGEVGAAFVVAVGCRQTDALFLVAQGAGAVAADFGEGYGGEEDGKGQDG